MQINFEWLSLSDGRLVPAWGRGTRVPEWILVAVLLVEFVGKGDLGMKDTTCHIDSKSHNPVLPNIIQNDLI